MLAVELLDLFYGAAQALRQVSMTAEIGKVTCVLGRNGVGKTSLMRAIVGQQPIRSGAVKWDGEDIQGCRRICARRAASPSCRRAAKSSRC